MRINDVNCVKVFVRLFIALAILMGLSTCTGAGSGESPIVTAVRSVEVTVRDNVLEIDWDVAENTDLDTVEHFSVEVVQGGKVIARRIMGADQRTVSIPLSATIVGEYTLNVVTKHKDGKEEGMVSPTGKLPPFSTQAMPPKAVITALRPVLKTEGNSTVTVTWSGSEPGKSHSGSPANIVSQTLYWKAGDTVSAQDYDETASNIKEEHYTVEGLEAGIPHAFLVEIKNNAQLGAESNVATITTATQQTVAPGTVILAPTNISTISKRDIAHITLEFNAPDAGSDAWGEAASMSHYAVYWKAGLAEGSSFTAEEADDHLLVDAAEVTSADRVSIEISGLVTDTVYGLILEVTNSASYTSTSAIARVQTNPTSPVAPAAIQGLELNATEEVGVRVSWDVADAEQQGTTEEGAPASFKQYIVYWSKADEALDINDVERRIIIDDINSNTEVITTQEGLKGATTYTVALVVENDTESTNSRSVALTQEVRTVDRTAAGGALVLAEERVIPSSGSNAPIIEVSFTAPYAGTNAEGVAYNIERYTVYYKASFSGGSLSKEDEGVVTVSVEPADVTVADTATIILEGLELDTNYGIFIEASRTEAGPITSNTVSKRTYATLGVSAPSQISGLRVDSASDAIRLTVAWDVADAEKLGTTEEGTPANFKQYMVYWSKADEALDINDVERRIIIDDINSNTEVITTQEGLKGATTYTVALVVENDTGRAKARSLAVARENSTADFSTAPGAVENIAKSNDYTVNAGLKIVWEAVVRGTDADGNAVGSLYRIYAAEAQEPRPTAEQIITGETTQQHSTRERYYELTGLSGHADYDVVVVAENEGNATLRAISPVYTLRSNGVGSIRIVDVDGNDVGGTTVSMTMGEPITLRGDISVENVADTVIWQSSDTSIINIPTGREREKSITSMLAAGGTVELTLRSEIDPDKNARITIAVVSFLSDIVVTDYLAEGNIRNNYILLEIKTEEGISAKNDYRLALKASSEDPPLVSEMEGLGVRVRNIGGTAKYVLLFSVLGEEPDYVGKLPLVAEGSAPAGVLPGLLAPGTEYTLYGAEAGSSRVYSLGSYSTDPFNTADFSGAGGAVRFLDTAFHTSTTHGSLPSAEGKRAITVRSDEPILIPSSLRINGNTAITHAFNMLPVADNDFLWGDEWKIPTRQLVSMLWSKGAYSYWSGPGNKSSLAEFTTLSGLEPPQNDGTKNAKIVTPAYDNYGGVTVDTYRRSTHVYMLYGPNQLRSSRGKKTVKRVTTWGHSKQLDDKRDFENSSNFSAITFSFEE